MCTAVSFLVSGQTYVQSWRLENYSVQQFLEILDKEDRLSWNVGNFQPTLRIIPEERRSHSHRGVNTKSCNCRFLRSLKDYWFHCHGNWKINAVELHLSELIWTECHPDMEKIRNIGFFSLTIGYIGSSKFGCYYLQYVPVSRPFDHARFDVLEATTVYCIWSDKQQFQGCCRIHDKYTQRPSRFG